MFNSDSLGMSIPKLGRNYGYGSHLPCRVHLDLFDDPESPSVLPLEYSATPWSSRNAIGLALQESFLALWQAVVVNKK